MTSAVHLPAPCPTATSPMLGVFFFSPLRMLCNPSPQYVSVLCPLEELPPLAVFSSLNSSCVSNLRLLHLFSSLLPLGFVSGTVSSYFFFTLISSRLSPSASFAFFFNAVCLFDLCSDPPGLGFFLFPFPCHFVAAPQNLTKNPSFPFSSQLRVALAVLRYFCPALESSCSFFYLG